MKTKTAYVEVRSQKARGTWPNSGPDTYVAVQVVPKGVEPLKQLNHRVAELRGIEVIHCGEGYSSRCATTRSALGAALAEANEVADQINRDEAAKQESEETKIGLLTGRDW